MADRVTGAFRLFQSGQTGADPPPMPGLVEERPEGEGILDLLGEGGDSGLAPQFAMVTPFGVGSEGQQFRAYGFKYLQTESGLWVPHGLVTLLCTLGAMPGKAGHDVLDTEMICKKIVNQSGTGDDRGDVNAIPIDFNDARVGHVPLDLREGQLMRWTIGILDATSGNLLIQYVGD